MILGGHYLHLYCENRDVHDFMINVTWYKKMNRKPGGHGEYTGETFKQCKEAAEQDGWVFTKTKNKVYCPHCKKSIKGKGQKKGKLK